MKCSRCGDTTPRLTVEQRYGYGDAGHPFDPDKHGRCRKAGSGYCDGTSGDPQHELREVRRS